MEYNYLPPQAWHHQPVQAAQILQMPNEPPQPPPPQMQMAPVTSNPMMYSSMPQQSVRQVIMSGPQLGHPQPMQQQPQQHANISSMQQQQHHVQTTLMAPQQHHHIPPPSHSASPHHPSPHHTPNHLLHQPSRPSTGPSPHQQPFHHHHQQQPHHIHTPHHMQPQQIHHNPPPQIYQNIAQTELRMIEFSRRLQNRPRSRHMPSPLPIPGSDENGWWHRFACDFFDDDSSLTYRLSAEDGHTEYKIGRTLIPRFFRSYFDGGVEDLQMRLSNSREISHQHMITLECDQADFVTKNRLGHPSNPNMVMHVIVHTIGYLSIDFIRSFDNILIKSWKFYVLDSREYIDRSMLASVHPKSFLVEPSTRNGLTKSTITYLKMCMIMEPMQDLMVQHIQTNLHPRRCLKNLLFDRYSFNYIEDNIEQPSKRKRRKAPTNPSANTGTKKSKANTNKNVAIASNNNKNNLISPVAGGSTASSVPLASQDVMVVGEPSMMGTDFSDENERTITRMENGQYVPTPPTTIDLELTNESKGFQTVETNDVPCNIVERIRADKSPSPPKIQQTSNSSPNVQGPHNPESEQTPNSLTEVESYLSQTFENDIDDGKTSFELMTLPEPTITPETQSNSPPTQEIQKKDISSEFPTKIIDNTSLTDEVARLSSELESDTRRQTPEESLEKENDAAVLNDEGQIFNTYSDQHDVHPNVMNSIPEEGEGSDPPSSSELLVSKIPSTSNNKAIMTISNGSSNKQNRRRSSERKETLRQGHMETSDFVVAIKDLKCEHPPLWRITTGNNLLQQFEPKTRNGVILYENTNQYAGWNGDIKRDYVGVDVKLTQHTRNQITVERLLLNFEKIVNKEAFQDRHFVIYLQILISTALDPKFWESIENEPEHHDYFISSRRVIEDITKRFKSKLANKLKLSEVTLKNVEKYPNLLVKAVENGEKAQLCRACNTNTCSHLVTFGNRSYDLHSYQPVKVTSELTGNDEKEAQNLLCDVCLDLVRLYSEIHHMGWKLFNLAREKTELHRTKGKAINTILDECMKDEDWLSTIYAERDAIWSRAEEATRDEKKSI